MSVSRFVVSGLALVGLVGSVGCGSEDLGEAASDVSGQSDAGIVPTVAAGNPTCAALGLGSFELKKDAPDSGSLAIPGTGSSITYTRTGLTLSWSSSLISIDAVLIKGGDQANVYLYPNEAFEDAGLVSPDNSSGGPAAISHINFCYDYEVLVAKTATTSVNRTWSWLIDKMVGLETLLLSAGQTYQMPYSVKVSRTHSTDSDWAVAGTITVTNPHPTQDATVTSVTDSLSGFDGTITPVCAVTFPKTLAPGASFTCTYASALPDGSDRTNTATATAIGDVGTGTGTAAVTFSSATVNHVDECVTIDDTLHGSLGEVCATQTINYLHDIGPFAACSQLDVPNTATFTTVDSGSTGSDTATVAVTVACPPAGCTLTQGYWKTHSAIGPAPYDDTWASHEDDHFFLSNASYYSVLWTPPAGNSYYTLAHQYIAAWLNGLNGADITDAASAFNAATVLLQTYSPSQVGVLKSNNTIRKQFVALAGVLASFNEGSIGPGHCSE